MMIPKHTSAQPSTRTLFPLAWVIALGFSQAAHAQACDPVEAAKLIANDGMDYDELGYSIATNGQLAVVGAPTDDDNGPNSGSVYIFAIADGAWTQQAKLHPHDGAADDEFGSAVSISGSTIIVGSHQDDDGNFNAGSAYIFTYTDGNWAQQAKLLADDGGWQHLFGSAVAISNDTVIIGAKGDDGLDGNDYGSAYTFTRTDGIWTQQAKLMPNDGEPFEYFGNSVSISADTAVVGAYRDDDNGSNSGSAYIYHRTGTAWTLQAELLAHDGERDDEFGISVAIHNDTAIVGANNDDDMGSNSGSVHVFTRTDDLWSFQTKLLADDGSAGDDFGYSVSISGDKILIGASWDDEPFSASGSAYLFLLSDGVWSQQAKLLPADGWWNDRFAESVAISGNTAAIGAFNTDDDTNGWDSGSVYIFDLSCPTCTPDLNADGTLDFFDVSAFLQAFNAQDPVADFDNDSVFTFFDISAFLQAFAAGCP